MSGGSWDYLYRQVEEAAARMEAEAVAIERPLPHRLAFAAHLRKVADALHAIEWVDSSDWGDGDDLKPIAVALGEPALADLLAEALREMYRVYGHDGWNDDERERGLRTDEIGADDRARSALAAHASSRGSDGSNEGRGR